MYQHSESAAEEEEEGKSHPSGYWQDSGHRDRELAVYETLQHVCRPYGVSGVCCRAIRSVRLAGSAVVSRPVPLRGRFASLDTATVPAQVAAIGWPGGCDDAGGRGCARAIGARAGVDWQGGQRFSQRLVPVNADVVDWVRRLPGPVAVAYEYYIRRSWGSGSPRRR